ncbi:MAG: DNA repair protein RecO [Ectothiorhodospiraceae bacterium]|nr:DNA repair protein RecO [Ectothiorhodospiraceae bacterium]MCH8503038.1 DNA repair protein RecO [Ectothiorhodospiraceae bacterium]
MTAEAPDELEAAYVLHRRGYRDTSLIVELFTARHGRVGVVARGARAARSRWRGLLEPFQPLLATWRGRGELQTLVQAEAAGPALRLRRQRLASGFYVNEILLRLLRRQDTNTELFIAYSEAMMGLASETDETPILRVFEKRLLQSLGYGLLLDQTGDSGVAVSPERRYRYEPGVGPLESSGSGRGTFSGAALLALQQERWEADSEDLLREAQLLMRAVLAPHLGPQPLRSRALYRQLKRGK